jgi:riboflavin synthase
MFTGLVQGRGVIKSITTAPGGVRLVIHASSWSHRPRLGDSIAICGCCLTIVDEALAQQGLLAFDLVPETLAKTSLSQRAAGDLVNLEHAVRADTLMGGHFVQGHVDGVGQVVFNGFEQTPSGQAWRLTIRLGPELLKWMIPKGSIAIEGVSLTIARIEGDLLSVALIPTTLQLTTLESLKPGDRVNIEGDMLVKAVVRTMEQVLAHQPR